MPKITINEHSVAGIRRWLCTANQELARSMSALASKTGRPASGGTAILQEQARELLHNVHQSMNTLLSRMISLSTQTAKKEIGKGGDPSGSDNPAA